MGIQKLGGIRDDPGRCCKWPCDDEFADRDTVCHDSEHVAVVALGEGGYVVKIWRVQDENDVAVGGFASGSGVEIRDIDVPDAVEAQFLQWLQLACAV